MATKKASAPEGLADAKQRLTRKPGRTTPKKDTESLGEPTSAAAWKKGKTEGLLVRVPSGNTALIRTPGLEVFVRKGTIPNALIPLIQKSLKTGKEPTEDELAEVLGDDEGLDKIIDLAENVLVEVCIDPKVLPAPVDEEGNRLPDDHPDRDPDVLYADDVDFLDKMYIFSVATGGPSQMEAFRKQSGLDVGPVQSG